MQHQEAEHQRDHILATYHSYDQLTASARHWYSLSTASQHYSQISASYVCLPKSSRNLSIEAPEMHSDLLDRTSAQQFNVA